VIEAAEADVIEAAEIASTATVAAELEQGTLEDMDSRHRPEPSDSGSGSISVRGGGGEDEGHSEHQDGDEGSEDAGEWTVLVHGESGRDYWLNETTRETRWAEEEEVEEDNGGGGGGAPVLLSPPLHPRRDSITFGIMPGGLDLLQLSPPQDAVGGGGGGAAGV
jgi:hypothetical protein